MDTWKQKRYRKAKKAYAALMKFYPLTLENLEDEEWADIAGYEGLYQVSNFGRVKSFWHGKTKILKPLYSAAGYLTVDVCKSNQKKRLLISRLVATCFIPNDNGKPQVDHIDGHPMNNHVSNLRWATGSENAQFAVGLGLIKTGDKNTRAKLTAEQVNVIRENAEFFTQKQLADMFGVSQTTISRIQIGYTHKFSKGTIRNKQRYTQLPTDIRTQICNEFISGSEQFGCHALAKKYNVSVTTVWRIVHER